jgi:hypothetical protein
LTEKQAAELIENGNLAIDEREDDEVATVEDEIKFVSPDKTGVYDVFLADGGFRECLIIINPVFINKKPARELCLVVDWKRRHYTFAKTAAVLCVAGSYKEDWFDRLPAEQFRSATNMRNQSEEAECEKRIIVTEDGNGTCPFSAACSGDGTWYVRAGSDTFFDGIEGHHRDRTFDLSDCKEDESVEVIKLKPKWVICSPTLAGRKMVIRNGKLILPKTFKYIDADPDYEHDGLALATENDVIHLLHKDRKKLRAAKTAANRYVLDGKLFDKTAAFKTLVQNYSFRSKTANEILTALDIAGDNPLRIPYVTPQYKVAELPIDPTFGQGGPLSIGSLIADKTIDIKRGNEIGSEHYGKGTIPFIRTSDIVNWELKIDPVKCIPEEVYLLYKKRQDIKEKDVLFNKDGTFLIGRTAFITKEDEKIVIQSHILRIRLKNESRFDAYYLLYLLNQPIVQKQIAQYTFVQGTISTVGDRLNEIVFPVHTDKNKIKTISQQVKSIIDTKQAIKRSIAGIMREN